MTIFQLTITGEAESLAPSKDSDKRYTPAWLLSAVMDGHGIKQFDLDPCSDEVGNKNVKAKAFYTFEDDGLRQPWFGHIWMNWPFSNPLPWMQKLVDEWHQVGSLYVEPFDSDDPQLARAIDSVTVLARCDMSTRWAKEALSFFDVVCHPRDRIAFEGCESSPDFTCVLFHKGPNYRRWAKVAKHEIGPCLMVL
jgi:hypothetical protein